MSRVLLEAQDLAASYKRGGEVALLFSEVNFCIEAGKIYDLLGPSGSGKSTLLRVLALMLDKTAGELTLKGKESSAFTPIEWRSHVCLVPQTPSLISGTVRENLLLPWKFKLRKGQTPPSDTALREYLLKAELADIELERDASQLSGGQLARIALLRAFLLKPSLLLLDEVDAALDDEATRAIGVLTQHMAEQGSACLRIRHRASDGYATTAFVMRDGSLKVAQSNEVHS